MQEIKMREERQGDAEAIAVVNRSAFGGEDEAHLVVALRTSPSFVPELFLVAEVGGRIFGHFLLFRATLMRPQGKAEDVLALAPMAVVPSQSHRGIGSMLIQEAIRRASALGYGAIVVVGHPDYYTRFDFTQAARHGVRGGRPGPGGAGAGRGRAAGARRGGGRGGY